MTHTTTKAAALAAGVVAVVGAFAGPAAAAAADAPRPAECFGGPATAVVTGETGTSDPVIIGDTLYWQSGSDLRQMPFATKVKSKVAFTGAVDVKVFDGKLAVGGTNINNLEAIDLPSGKRRILVEGETTMEEPTLFSSLALDDKYLYFGRGENRPPFTRSPRIGFHRVRRAGGAAPELLGTEPDAHTTFVVADGFVYWRNVRRLAASEKRIAELMRRRLQKDAPAQVIAPLQWGGRAPLVVHGGRVYYTDGDAIMSVPVAGGAPPVTHVTTGPRGAVDLVADGLCVYWLNGTGAIQRARGERGVAERIGAVPVREHVPDSDPYRVLATDGTRLYWADGKAGNIMAVGRDAQSIVTAVRTIVAKPTAAKAPQPMGPDRLLVGSGWGCARMNRRRTRQMQCWQVPPATTAAEPAIRARPVPWLASDHYAAAADRLCAQTATGTRCWRPAELFGPAPRDVSFAPMSEHTVWDPELAAGGGVTCTEKDNVWTCAGDDSFGQLGKGTAAVPGDRLFGGRIALGAYHGCVAGDAVLCWGRNDTMQLGFPSKQTCNVGGRDVPCSRGAKTPSFPLSQGSGIYAADTFSCARRGDIECWGASRDGWFGTAAACPPALRTAFPTRSGPVAAPNATCSATAVELPAFPRDPQRNRIPLYSFAVGPRGACGVVGRTVKCAGAIPTPPDLNVEGLGVGSFGTLDVSPGDDPSACAMVRGGVTCWGAGYSAAATPNHPVNIAFTDIASDGPGVDADAAPATKWPQGCGINEGCAPRPSLPPCPAGLAEGAIDWSAMGARARENDGRQVVVRGPLLVQAAADATPPPKQRCAPADPLPIVVGKDKNPLVLDGLACNGDESRRCCATPAFGQEVIARGKLAASGSFWILRDPQLCTTR